MGSSGINASTWAVATPVSSVSMIYQEVLAFCLVALSTEAPRRFKRQTANEVATRIVAVSKSKPELLSTAVSAADPDLLRVALTDADPELLKVALTKAKAELLATALTEGVDGDLLRVALTEARPGGLQM